MEAESEISRIPDPENKSFYSLSRSMGAKEIRNWGRWGGDKKCGGELPTSRMKNGAGSGHRKHSVALAEVKPPGGVSRFVKVLGVGGVIPG